ncbi:MAG TPA: response regulator [bacterium]|nr:response regulator [bacterium]
MPEQTGKTIIAVDDSELNLMMMQSFLEPMGHNVIVATNGKDALELIRTEIPDLILLDVMMPEMDGFEVCRRIKSNDRTRHIPVIMITALDKVEDNVKGIEAGAEDFLTKPFDAVILAARMKALLQSKALFDEIAKLERLKEDMTSMIVHDLRTPMSSIKMSLEFLRDNIREEKLLDFISIASADIEDSLLLINNLLDIGKLEANKMEIRKEDTSLLDMLRDIAGRAKPLLMRGGLQLSVQSDRDEIFCEVDKILVGRVVTNLLANAIKFAESKSMILLDATQLDNGDVVFGVVNQGTNIPESYKKTIFEKFGQAKDQHNKAGTGLGLTFCKHVAEAHRGKIWVESPPKNFPSGAAFYVQLPLR